MDESAGSAPGRAAVAAQRRAPSGRASILLVEDEAIVALDLKMQIEDLGYEVVGVADTAAGAIDLASRHRPDLTLMDVVLRGTGDGIDAATVLRERVGSPVVFLTSFSDADTVSRAAQTGAYGYLTKPFQPRELRAGIEVALAKARLERQLRDSERWYAATLRCVQDAIVGTDPHARIRFMNAAAERMLGRAFDDVQGAPVDAVVTFAGPGDTVCALQAALDAGGVVGTPEVRTLKRPDGSTVAVDEWAGPVADEDGQCMGAVLVLRDVADRLQAAARTAELAEERSRRERGEAAIRAKNDLLARVSHEMRTPLNAVLGFAQLLRMHRAAAAIAPATNTADLAAADPAPAGEDVPARYADHILTAGQHLLSLVDDVLELQTPEQAPNRLQLEDVALAQVLADAVLLVQPLAAGAGVSLTHGVDPALRVRADARRLRQVIVNLVSNAVKYNRPQGHVVCTARVSAAPGCVLLEVVDDGIGMTAGQLTRLFEPFDRLGRENSAVPGVGLGLVISRKLVEDMGGRLAFESVPGGGTRAAVELPLAGRLPGQAVATRQ